MMIDDPKGGNPAPDPMPNGDVGRPDAPGETAGNTQTGSDHDASEAGHVGARGSSDGLL